MSGLKTLSWRALSVAVLLLSANVASAEYLFGFSNGNEVNRLTVDGSVDLFSGENQGWWSGNSSNIDSNSNYFVGAIDDGVILNNFFIFDISALRGPVSSAVLNLLFYTPRPIGGGNLTYGLFDVSTDLATLNHNQGTSWSIFNDLGTGKNYGTFSVSTGLPSNYVLSLTLNSTGLADLNAAIANNATQFAIGGTLLPTTSPASSAPDSASTLALFGAAVAGISILRLRKKQG